MSRALLLNASWEPLAIVTDRRMFKLYMAKDLEGNNKIEPIEMSSRTFRSKGFSVMIPSVARLTKYVELPAKHRSILLTTKSVLGRDGHECAYCGGIATTMDHIHPRGAMYLSPLCATTCGSTMKPHNGPHVWENVTASCRSCNALKSHLTLEEMILMGPDKPNVPGEKEKWEERWTLHRKPFRPLGVAAYLLAMKPEAAWLPYLGVAA